MACLRREHDQLSKQTDRRPPRFATGWNRSGRGQTANIRGDDREGRGTIPRRQPSPVWLGMVDEIIVVDTGSIDEGLTYHCRNARARASTRSCTWCDDFSAARNEALDLATGDWILYRCRRTIGATSSQVGTGTADDRFAFEQIALPAALRHRVSYRLFRRDPRIRFRWHDPRNDAARPSPDNRQRRSAQWYRAISPSRISATMATSRISCRAT